MSVTQVPFITLNRFENGFKEDFLNGVTELFDKTQFIGGPQVANLEETLASKSGAKYVVGCANGTDAIQLALRTVGVEKNELPGSLNDGALTAAFKEFPVERAVLFLGAFTEEGGNERESVGVGLRLRAREFTEGRGEIPEGGRMRGGLGSFNFSRPPGDGGNADPAFIKVALSAAEFSAGVEAVASMSAFLHRSVVAGKDDEGVVGDTEFVEFSK